MASGYQDLLSCISNEVKSAQALPRDEQSQVLIFENSICVGKYTSIENVVQQRVVRRKGEGHLYVCVGRFELWQWQVFWQDFAAIERCS